MGSREKLREGGEGANCGSLIWVRGQHGAKQEDGHGRRAARRQHSRARRFLLLPLTLTYTTLKDLRHSLLPHSCVVAALKEEPGKGREVHVRWAKVQRGVRFIQHHHRSPRGEDLFSNKMMCHIFQKVTFPAFQLKFFEE